NSTSRPGTWKASSTLFVASTFPGKERTCGSSPAVTTIVFTGRATSGGPEAVGEHPPARWRIARAIGTVRPRPPRLHFLAFMSASRSQRLCEAPPPRPPPRSGEGEKNCLSPLSASGRGPGGGVLAQALRRTSPPLGHLELLEHRVDERQLAMDAEDVRHF